MSIGVFDEILTATPITEAEMRQEIAVMFFQQEQLTLAQVSRFAGMHRNELDIEEAEAIALAVEIQADQVLMDERRGWLVAARLDLRYIRDLGDLGRSEKPRFDC